MPNKELDLELELELKRCHEVMDDIEHKLEDAYSEENPKEIKRCTEALETLEKEFFDIRSKVDKIK